MQITGCGDGVGEGFGGALHMWVACESLSQLYTMTIVGAVLPPVVVFTTGCAEQFWATCP